MKLTEEDSSNTRAKPAPTTIDHPLNFTPPKWLDDNTPRALHNTTPTRSRRKSRRGNGQAASDKKSSALSPLRRQSSHGSQQSDKSPSNNNINNKLPRSVRWRISLELLSKPQDDIDNQSGDQIYKSIENLNALKLRFQRSHYDELEKKHYWKSTPTAIADEATSNVDGSDRSPNDVNSQDEGNLHHVKLGDDPLSALLQRKGSKTDEHNKTADTEKKQGLFGVFGGGGNKKESNRARAKSKDNKEISSDTIHSLKRTKSDGTHASDNTNNPTQSACKGSRWAEFYSTREVLDVIEKDLDRMPHDHYTIYHEYRMRKKKLEKQAQSAKEKEEAEKRNGSRNEKAPLWKIGRSGVKKQVHSNENFAHMLLNTEDDNGNSSDSKDPWNAEKEQEEIQISIKERANRISQLLFVYARDHSEIGYRQGMHEVLSYILLALEMDLLDKANRIDRKNLRRSALSFGLANVRRDSLDNGSIAGVNSSGNIVVVYLLDENYILHDAYNIFECIMTALQPAYDVVPAGDDEVAAAAMMGEHERGDGASYAASDTSGDELEQGESPMEIMVSSIISKIRFIARDEQLFGLVLYMPVPPTLYFAKWIRLLFGRELAGGIKEVLSLWDAFFDLASARTSMNDDVPIPIALLDVLKAAAAGMILLIRDKLLAPSPMTGEPDPNNGIGYLMNYPPLEDIRPLVELISDLLAKEGYLSTQYQIAKERKLDKQYFLIESFNGTDTDHKLSTSVFQENLQNSFIKKEQQTCDYTNGAADNNKLPKVYRTCQASTPERKQYDSTMGHIVEEGRHIVEEGRHIVEEVVDFGSKTASAAISAIQQQYDKTHVDHPLQDASQPSNESDDYIITYRADVDVPDVPDLADEGEKNIPSSPSQRKSKSPNELDQSARSFAKSEERDVVEELDLFASGSSIQSVSIEQFNESIEKFRKSQSEELRHSQSSDKLDNSVSSKLSVAKSIGDSINKSPKELASMLERSVSTLMNHFNERINTSDDTSAASGSQSAGGINGRESVPEGIWHALADIDRVRKEIMQQDAIASLDMQRSSVSLRTSEERDATPTDDSGELRKLGVKKTTPRYRSGVRRGSQ